MKKTSLKQPKKSKLANRKGGAIKDVPGPRRSNSKTDYHGNKVTSTRKVT